MASETTPVRTIREQIADQLRADILSGNLPRGSKLREQHLAQRFGVSRGPIRDVLMQLGQQGLVMSEPNCGARVSDEAAEWMQPSTNNSESVGSSDRRADDSETHLSMRPWSIEISGVLRLRTIATKDVPCGAFPEAGDDGVILDIDSWVLMPVKA